MRKSSSTNFQNRKELLASCPVTIALSKIGNRWKPYILWKLRGLTLRYGELKQEIPFITDRMLNLSLKELEKDRFINKEQFKGYPLKVGYTLAKKGSQIQRVLNALCKMGESMVKENN